MPPTQQSSDSYPLSGNDPESFSITSDTTSSLVEESAQSEAPDFDGLFDSLLNGDDWFDMPASPEDDGPFLDLQNTRNSALHPRVRNDPATGAIGVEVVAHLRALRAEKKMLVTGYEAATMPLRDLPEWFDAPVRLT
ncbi:hypothetical protein L202_04452 [Cryptococcus amylolentus CBS 6039]|uniref:Uncharacterized protein n=1 Tax=Cryptococcus amylolentus CBS 6039 TaxID=1295533 RepID=A0A1E3HRE1_9TREE|nr:hypothetical protein L202_04452 [Cryptococcus amylolentus CBS 6039]ODN78929.1 hypothetical protein L202_04452 [Cryptococcus amylolentus CBS 6039]